MTHIESILRDSQWCGTDVQHKLGLDASAAVAAVPRGLESDRVNPRVVDWHLDVHSDHHQFLLGFP